MPWDLQDLNPATRFYWGDANEEWVELRIASDEDLRSFRKQLGIREKVEYPVNPATRKVDRVEYLDMNEDKQLAFSELINDFAIAGWKLLDRGGKEIPCTIENKNRMMSGSPLFSRWISDCLSRMRADLEAQLEAERKN